MKAWVIAGAAIVLISVSASLILLYQLTLSPLETRERNAAEVVLEDDRFSEILNVDFYHGRRSFQVVDAIDTEGTEWFIWIEEAFSENEENMSESNENEEEEPPDWILRRKNEGLSKDEVRGIAYNELAIKELKSIRLGIIGDTPIYEVNYIDDENRQAFYYVTFEDGSYIRHYQLVS